MLPYSAEIRWFFGGTIPELFHRWFGTADLEEPENRTDYYLRLSGCETTSVKLRGNTGTKAGNFEVKATTGLPAIVHYGNGVSGRTDVWMKWSNNDESAQDWLNTLLSDSGNWVGVKKTRWLRKTSLDQGAPEEVSTSAYPTQGCGIELTQLEVAQNPYWSVALEAFGGTHTVRQNLHRTVVWFLAKQAPPEPLALIHSYGYPTWLNTLGHDTREQLSL